MTPVIAKTSAQSMQNSQFRKHLHCVGQALLAAGTEEGGLEETCLPPPLPSRPPETAQERTNDTRTPDPLQGLSTSEAPVRLSPVPSRRPVIPRQLFKVSPRPGHVLPKSNDEHAFAPARLDAATATPRAKPAKEASTSFCSRHLTSNAAAGQRCCNTNCTSTPPPSEKEHHMESSRAPVRCHRILDALRRDLSRRVTPHSCTTLTFIAPGTPLAVMTEPPRMLTHHGGQIFRSSVTPMDTEGGRSCGTRIATEMALPLTSIGSSH